MTAITLEHPDPWTEDEYLALPESRQQVELLDGSLLVSPSPASDHQQLARRLANALEEAAPDELQVIEQINVRIGPARILIPDLIVTRRTGRVTIVAPGDLLLVAEVVSPSTTAKDRVLKPHLYGNAGIPWYLRVEPHTPDPPDLALNQLAGDAYVVRGHAGPGEQLTFPPPLDLTLDPAILMKRRS